MRIMLTHVFRSIKNNKVKFVAFYMKSNLTISFITLCSLYLLLTVGCRLNQRSPQHTDGIKTHSINHATLSNLKTLNGTPVATNFKSSTHWIHFYKNKLLIADSYATDKKLVILDPDHTEYVKTQISTGNGPNEMIDFSYASPIGQDSLLVLDGYEMNVYIYHLDSLLETDTVTPIYRTKLSHQYLQNPGLLPDGRFVTTSLGFEPLKRFHLFHPDGSHSESVSEYPSKDFPFEDFGIPDAFVNSLCQSPDLNKLAVANLYQDVVQVFDTQEGLTETSRISGPYHEAPILEAYVYETGGTQIIPVTDKTRDHYTGIACSDTQIWLLYNGNFVYDSTKPEDSKIRQSNTLIISDWKGEVQEVYRLEPPIGGIFTVDFDHNTIYGVNTEGDASFYKYVITP